MILFVLLVVVLTAISIAVALADSIAVAVADSDFSDKKEREESRKAEADVASAFPRIRRMLEALDIMESVLETYEERLRFCRNIKLSPKTGDTVFELQYAIIGSVGNPSAQETLDSLFREWTTRIAAKNSGETLWTVRSSDDYTVWWHLTDEQVELLHDTLKEFDERRNEENGIILEGALPLRFDNSPSRERYLYRANLYIKALAEAIRKKFPHYDVEANSRGIYFYNRTGVISYYDI